ncbi:LysM peptidoglycan-binding domain-containing protein [Sandarakinorhabdus sp.]|uniref:CIS tube protein n=1 Tax=Sandarakinorhabdus sp. TaxID=1916663 RepID=UPI00286EB2A3|nr:LysM peptidoglycan-binding domain-containing protein [Sandarakinorhabdus sp.]
MTKLEKAALIELEPDFLKEKPGGENVPVQFNPETLKVTFANQLVQPQGGDQAAGNTGRQFVGAGTTKLALTLWFDVTAMTENAVDDVRRLTQKIIYFMTPTPDKADAKKMVPPATRFVWGSFLFDGIVEGLEETLEYFSPDGKPLRAQISLTLGQQKILVATFTGDGKVPQTPGRTPMNQAKSGDSVQKMAARDGNSDWKSIASANGIEDPLRLKPGQLVDLKAGVSIGASIGVSGGVSGGFSGSASAGIQTPSISPPTVRLLN